MMINFTFMNGKKGIDWEKYVRFYADFINKHHIKKYFELDIDIIVGYDTVKKYRDMLKVLTGINPIPVWHKSRGKEDFLRMCDKYDYVAIGGIVTNEITANEYKYFPWFINEAHKRGCKIHGLGFTNMEWLKKCHFDSVDSTSWIMGGKYGSLVEFRDGRLKTVKKPDNTRAIWLDINIHNLNEWIKFQKYAEVNL